MSITSDTISASTTESAVTTTTTYVPTKVENVSTLRREMIGQIAFKAQNTGAPAPDPGPFVFTCTGGEKYPSGTETNEFHCNIQAAYDVSGGGAVYTLHESETTQGAFYATRKLDGIEFGLCSIPESTLTTSSTAWHFVLGEMPIENIDGTRFDYFLFDYDLATLQLTARAQQGVVWSCQGPTPGMDYRWMINQGLAIGTMNSNLALLLPGPSGECSRVTDNKFQMLPASYDVTHG